MIERSWQVLADCRIALAMLEDEKDAVRWRILWSGAVGLVRAVGHVLTAECSSSPKMRDAVRAAHQVWIRSDAAEHEIFRAFIIRERNSILKEYEFGVHPLAETEFVLQMRRVDDEVGQSQDELMAASLGENIYKPLLGDYREGDDARDVYSDAIDWWAEQLHLLEMSVSV